MEDERELAQASIERVRLQRNAVGLEELQQPILFGEGQRISPARVARKPWVARGCPVASSS